MRLTERNVVKKTLLTSIFMIVALVLAGVVHTMDAWAVATFDGGTSTVPITRSIEGVTNPVTNTFSYTVTADASNPAEGVSGAPTSAQIKFENVAPENGKVTQNGVVDFSSAVFSKTGDYKFKITETGSADTLNYPVNNTEYSIVISVRYALDANNVPTEDLVVSVAQQVEDKTNNKTDAKWVSAANRTYIEIATKTVGNSGDVNRYFIYTINIPLSNRVFSGDTFKISGGSFEENPKTLKAGVPTVIHLKHGETITIGQDGTVNQLPVGVTYTVALTENNNQYSTKVDGVTGTTVTKVTVPIESADFEEANVISFENKKDDSVLTGIVTNFWFYLILLVIGVAGLVIVNRVSRKTR